MQRWVIFYNHVGYPTRVYTGLPYLVDERFFSFLINLVGPSTTGIRWFLKEPYDLSDSVIVDGVFGPTFRGKTETNYPNGE